MTLLPIDTLQYANRLEGAGVGREQADAMARALEEQLTERMPTKADMDKRFDYVDRQFARVDEKFARVDRQFARVDEQFARVDEQFARVDEQFARVDEKFEALEVKFDAKLDTLRAEVAGQFGVVDARFEAVDARLNALDGKLQIIIGMMIFGFTLLSALGLFQSYRTIPSAAVDVAAAEQPKSAPEVRQIASPTP